MISALKYTIRYGLAVVSVAIAAGLGLLAESSGIPRGQLSLFLLAFTITVWYAGVGPGILNFILGSTAFNFFFTPPLPAFEKEWKSTFDVLATNSKRRRNSGRY
jgi:K+-sensing histidine kinase KdpD